jgi:hypothetical protein
MGRSRYQPVYLVILEMLASMLSMTEFTERLRELWMAGKVRSNPTIAVSATFDLGTVYDIDVIATSPIRISGNAIP